MAQVLKMREVDYLIHQAKTQQDLDKCEQMLQNMMYGRGYLMGKIEIMRSMIEVISTVENCHRDNPKMLITLCLIEPVKKFRQYRKRDSWPEAVTH